MALRSLPLIITCIGLLTGCGARHEGIVPVSGIVTIDGQPLTHGQIIVHPEGHRACQSHIGSDGRFRLTCFKLYDGAPVGTHVATILSVESLSETSRKWHAPKSYASEASSGLWVTIDGPTDDLKIELSWKDSKEKAPYVENF